MSARVWLRQRCESKTFVVPSNFSCPFACRRFLPFHKLAFHPFTHRSAHNKLQLNGLLSKIFTSIYFGVNHELFSRLQTFFFPSPLVLMKYRTLFSSSLLFRFSALGESSPVKVSSNWSKGEGMQLFVAKTFNDYFLYKFIFEHLNAFATRNAVIICLKIFKKKS